MQARRTAIERVYPELRQLCQSGHRLVLAKDDSAAAHDSVAQADECVNEADSKCDFEGLMQSLIQCVRESSCSRAAFK